jgi:putative isomerase
MLRIPSAPPLLAVLASLACVQAHAQTYTFPGPGPAATCGAEYEAMKGRLAQGWNTWDTRSFLSHVLLPEGIAIRLQVRDLKSGRTLENALIHVQREGEAEIRLGPHAYDGSYTELMLKWQGIGLRVQSAAVGDDQVFLVTPLEGGEHGAILVRPEMLFGKPGAFTVAKEAIDTRTPGKIMPIFVMGKYAKTKPGTAEEYLTLLLDEPIAISTGTRRDIEASRQVVDAAKRAFERDRGRFGELADLYAAQQTALAWNVIYDQTKDRVIAPISRRWSVGLGGYVLFCWDTYLAAYMFSLDSKELAYANAIEVTKENTEGGLVPNLASAYRKSHDRSQPPVGSLVVREIYRKYREKWFVREVFEDLLRWNRWWGPNRVTDGFLCWGSAPYEGYDRNPRETPNVNTLQGGKFESGLDNSPMYDDIPFDAERHQMLLADVGLTALYVMDCDALADLADELGREAESKELRSRADKYRKNLAGLWSEKTGLYLNKRLDTGAFSDAISPTAFYPFLAKAPTREQAERMIQQHFYNPTEFWGEWIMPSIARNHPAYKDNSYWRGRIWAPLNFLVYVGMRNYPIEKARKDLVEKSAKLLLKAWREHGYVCENYNADTGVGDDVKNSDRFYHWGALVGFISFIEEGHVPAPENPLRPKKPSR